MDKNTLVEKIFSIINFQKKIDYSDPDYQLIEALVDDLYSHTYQDFYFFINTSSKYHNQFGALVRTKLQDAVRDFNWELKNQLWTDYGMEDIAYSIHRKLVDIAKTIYNLNAEATEKYLSNTGAEDVMFTNESGKHPLFTLKEIAVIKDVNFKSLMYEILDYALYSDEERTKDTVEKIVKSFIVEEYLKEKESKLDKKISLTFDL